MPECLPFCGWLYNLEKVRLSEVLAPPYDVVTSEEVAEYKKKSPYNIFHLELAEDFEEASSLLKRFIEEHILVKNGKPTLYYHELAFNYEGKAYLRKGLILLVKLYSFEEGIILPHEKVYAKVTEDRFKLLKATGFQFSQIYGLYEDPTLETLKNLSHNAELFGEVVQEGETQRLAKIQDVNIINKVSAFLKDKNLFIADGHHRYTTALKYKAYMESLYGKEEGRDYQYMAMYLSPFEDENLLMLPTHRIYKLSLKERESLLKGISEMGEVVEETISSEWNTLKFELYGKGDCFALFDGETLKVYKLKSNLFSQIKAKEPELSALPLYNFLQLLEATLGVKEATLKEQGKVDFYAQEEEVFKKTQKEKIGVLFPRVSAEILKKIASKRKLMPHKSTYFYPKILTGFVMNQIKGSPVK